MKAAYYPILKWKQGEQAALQGLGDHIKDKICPVIEVRNDAKSCRELYATLDHCWKRRPFIIDYADPSGLLIDRRMELMSELLCRIEGNNDDCLMFCLWLKMIETGDLDQIIDRVKRLNQPMCIRIQGKCDNLLQGILRLKFIYEKYAIDPSKVILLLDSKTSPLKVDTDQDLLAKALSSEHVKSHYAVVMASGAFPKTKALNSNKEIIERTDMMSWLRISDLQEQQGSSSVVYSDYTCHDPSWEDETGNEKKTFGYVKPLIRYAEDSKWLIYKVTAAEDAIALTRLLLRQATLIKSCQCPGCYQMKRRVTPEGRLLPGNYANHLTEGIIHHIYTVIERNLEI